MIENATAHKKPNTHAPHTSHRAHTPGIGGGQWKGRRSDDRETTRHDDDDTTPGFRVCQRTNLVNDAIQTKATKTPLAQYLYVVATIPDINAAFSDNSVGWHLATNSFHQHLRLPCDNVKGCRRVSSW